MPAPCRRSCEWPLAVERLRGCSGRFSTSTAQPDHGSLAGAGNVTLAAATRSAGNDGSSTAFLGAISGSGGSSRSAAARSRSPARRPIGRNGREWRHPADQQLDRNLELTSVSNGGTLTGSGTVGATGSIPAVPSRRAPHSRHRDDGRPAIAFQAGALSRTGQSGGVDIRHGRRHRRAGRHRRRQSAAGSYIAKQYDILHSAGLGGTMFSGFPSPTCRRALQQPDLRRPTCC